MTTSSRYLKILIRLSGAGAMLLGLTIWSGHARSWLPVHMLLGIVLVLSVCATAALAFQSGTRRGFATFVLLWSLGIVVFGRLQALLLPGPHHWIVSLTHLLSGGIAIALGASLAGAVEHRPGGSAA